MSILSTLAFVIAAAVRPKTRDVEITELEAKIDHLTRERDEARLEADRWRALARRWEVRYEQAAQPDVTVQQQALAAYQLAMMQARNAQNDYANAYSQMNMLGAQNLMGAFEHVCNCAPGRQDFLTG